MEGARPSETTVEKVIFSEVRWDLRHCGWLVFV